MPAPLALNTLVQTLRRFLAKPCLCETAEAQTIAQKARKVKNGIEYRVSAKPTGSSQVCTPFFPISVSLSQTCLGFREAPFGNRKAYHKDHHLHCQEVGNCSAVLEGASSFSRASKHSRLKTCIDSLEDFMYLASSIQVLLNSRLRSDTLRPMA